MCSPLYFGTFVGQRRRQVKSTCLHSCSASLHFFGASLLAQIPIGIKRYETAFNMLHKLRAAMVRPKRDPIGGEWPVKLDETYVGDETQGEGPACSPNRLHRVSALPFPPVPAARHLATGALAPRHRMPCADSPRALQTHRRHLKTAASRPARTARPARRSPLRKGIERPILRLLRAVHRRACCVPITTRLTGTRRCGSIANRVC